VCKFYSLSSSWSFLCIIWSLKRTGAEQNSINIAKVVLLQCQWFWQLWAA
jgi:hypothetical protein